MAIAAVHHLTSALVVNLGYVDFKTLNPFIHHYFTKSVSAQTTYSNIDYWLNTH